VKNARSAFFTQQTLFRRAPLAPASSEADKRVEQAEIIIYKKGLDYDVTSCFTLLK
jgi:uncharacterized protein YqgV (UPF0045/DUF77 family)